MYPKLSNILKETQNVQDQQLCDLEKKFEECAANEERQLLEKVADMFASSSARKKKLVQTSVDGLRASAADRTGDLQKEMSTAHVFTSTVKKQWSWYMKDTETQYVEDTASVERGRSGLEHGLQDCMTKAKMDSQQWRTAQDSLMSLGEQNVASVDSIVRTGMEANQLLRVKLSSTVSTALEDVNVASNGFLSSIDCSLKLDHDARASIDSIINPSRNELRALKSGHYHKTVEITANSDKYLEEDYVVDVPSCSTPKKRLINLPTNTSIEELRTPAFEDLSKSFWEAKSASKQISNEDVKHFLGRHDFQTQASRDFNERVPLVDIN